MKKILIKLTSRERPEQLATCIRAMKERAMYPDRIQYILTLDTDDSSLGKYLNLPEIMGVIISVNYSDNKIHAINRDIPIRKGQSEWDILVNVSDDQLCIAWHWDMAIDNAMTEDLDSLLWFADGIQNRINTMYIAGRNYFNRFGQIYNPVYKSFFADNEVQDIAEGLGKQIKSNEILFKHNHPQLRGGVKDALFLRNQKEWFNDERIYKTRKANGFKD